MSFFVVKVVISMLLTIVLIEGVLSYSEGTFCSWQSGVKKIKLYFIWHFGVVVGDLILIPLAIYWSGQYLILLTMWTVIYFIVAFGITWIAHKAWWHMCKDQTGFMYPNREYSRNNPEIWHADLPMSARMHFVYMILAVIFIEAYIFSPMPSEIVRKIFWIFVIFIPFGVIEPGIVQGWPLKKKDWIIQWCTALALWTLNGVVAWTKLIHWWIF